MIPTPGESGSATSESVQSAPAEPTPEGKQDPPRLVSGRSAAAATDVADTDVDVVINASPVVPTRVRRPADALRLVLALAVLVAAQLVAGLAHVGVRTSERALIESVVTIAPVVRNSVTGAVQLIAVLLPPAIILAVAAGRRFALAGRLILAGLFGIGAGLLDSHLLLTNSHPSIWPHLLAGEGGVFAVTFPPVAWLTGITAMLTVGGDELSRRWRVGLWWLVAIIAVVEVLVGGFLPLDAAAAAALGVSVGSLFLLAFGGRSSRPAASEVVDALRQCAIELVSLTEVPSARKGPALYRAAGRNGASLIVCVYSTDDRDQDRLARLTRWLLVRGPQDDILGTTVESAAEHETLAMVAARGAGARVPEPLVAYPVLSRRGPPSALVAWVDVGGQRLDLVSPERLADAALTDLWQSVAHLGKHRLAHRRLRCDKVLVDGNDHAWITGLVLAQLGAGDPQLATDVAELLASLALHVGVERTVTSAVATLGAAPVVAAAPYLQPLAMSATTQAQLRAYDRARAESLGGGRRRRLMPGGRPDLLKDVRSAVSEATGEPAPKLEQLSRFTWKRALTLLGAFAVIYLVLPQLANAGGAIRALGHANWWWVLAAVPAIFVAQAFSTILQRGAVPAQLPFGSTYVVEFGGSFLNRITPNNVGGMALNLRYLQKAGVDTGAATGSVGVLTLASTGGNLVLLAVFFAVTGRHTAVHFSWHPRQSVLLAISVVLAALALVGLTPWGRRFFRNKIWAFLRSAGSTLAGVAKSPHQVALVTVGALGGPMVQIVALALCVHAVGGHLPFVQVGAIYLGAHVLASAAPVPGGLGALEAALIAGLSALGMPPGAAASAVLIYRLLTYWLTIPVGWFALKIAEGRDYV